MTQFTIRRFRVVGFIAVVVGVGVAQADEPGPAAPGPRVRLTAPSVSIDRDIADRMLEFEQFTGDFDGLLQFPIIAIEDVEG